MSLYSDREAVYIRYQRGWDIARIARSVFMTEEQVIVLLNMKGIRIPMK